METSCGSCGGAFEAKRSTARYCSVTCRSRAARERKAAAESTAADAAAGKAEHELVKAVRLELEKAKALDTVAGQLALQVARRIANPECSGVSTLSKELRALLAEAKGDGGTPPAGDAAAAKPAVEDDEVTRARRAREKSRQAVGLA